MSATRYFPWTLLLASAVATLGGRTARADEMVLSGPHPFLKENAVTLQFVSGSGFGDSFSGRGIGVGYGYMLDGSLWLDLQMNARLAACGPFAACGTYTGSATELLAGVAWKMRTNIPLVPVLRADVGLVYLYPNSDASAVGLAARAGAGLRYYVFDWLGFTAEAAVSLGHGYFATGYAGSRTYAVGDLVLGVEVQFQ